MLYGYIDAIADVVMDNFWTCIASIFTWIFVWSEHNRSLVQVHNTSNNSHVLPYPCEEHLIEHTDYAPIQCLIE